MVMFQHRINVLVAVGLAVSMGTVEAACQGMALHAHRGASSAPENSLSAYVAVAEGPWDGMETDIQQLRDGAWVLHHDALTGRVVSAGPAKPASHLSSTEWRVARMKARDRRLTDEAPPFLAQLIDASADHPQKTLNIEMKQPYRGCAPIQRVVDQLSNGVGHGNWFLTTRYRQCSPSSRYDKFSPAWRAVFTTFLKRDQILRSSLPQNCWGSLSMTAPLGKSWVLDLMSANTSAWCSSLIML